MTIPKIGIPNYKPLSAGAQCHICDKSKEQNPSPATKDFFTDTEVHDSCAAKIEVARAPLFARISQTFSLALSDDQYQEYSHKYYAARYMAYAKEEATTNVKKHITPETLLSYQEKQGEKALQQLFDTLGWKAVPKHLQNLSDHMKTAFGSKL